MKLSIQKNSTTSSFTLIELLIAAAIFSVLMIASGTLFAQVARSNQRLTMQNYAITEGRFLIDKLSREIKKSTIDYEQYYQKSVNNLPNGYGHGFGQYAFQFFDPGADTKSGYKCSDGTTECSDTTKIIQNTIDIDTGKHKYDAANVTEMEKYSAVTNNIALTSLDYQQDELYLIDSVGKTRTLLKLKNSKLQMLKLTGIDENQDGINEYWKCHDDWVAINSDASTCNSKNKDIDGSEFIDITPENTKITNVKFTIYPVEDSHKAFREPIALRSQPRVTIYLELTPLNTGALPVKPIALQTTISSQVYYSIPSYNKFKGKTW